MTTAFETTNDNMVMLLNSLYYFAMSQVTILYDYAIANLLSCNVHFIIIAYRDQQLCKTNSTVLIMWLLTKGVI